MNHKLSEMVNVARKKCTIADCPVTPSFNYKGKTSLYCNAHKLDGMVNVESRKCAEINCFKQPCFSFPDDRDVFCCKKHIVDGMINIYRKYCNYADCGSIPSFNFEKLPAIFCSKHKASGMINVRIRKCIAESCIMQARFDYPGSKKGIYCKTHRTPDTVNILDKRRIKN